MHPERPKFEPKTNPEARQEYDTLTSRIQHALEKLADFKTAQISQKTFEEVLSTVRDERDRAYLAVSDLRAWQKQHPDEADPRHEQYLRQIVKVAEAKVNFLEDIYRTRFPFSVWEQQPYNEPGSAAQYQDPRTIQAGTGHYEGSVANKDVAEGKEDLRRHLETKFLAMLSVLGSEELEGLLEDAEENLATFQEQLDDTRVSGFSERDDLGDRINLTEWQIAQLKTALAERRAEDMELPDAKRAS